MKLRSAQIGRPTWSELNETIIEYLKEAMREHDQPIKFELVPSPRKDLDLPTYQLTVKDARK